MRLALAAAVSLVALSACGGGDDEPDAPEPSATESSAPEPTDDPTAAARDCLIGTWKEDMVNLENQWTSGAGPSGGVAAMPVTGLTGDNRLTVTADAMTYDVAYDVTTEGPTGSSMTGQATVAGASALDYEVESPTAMTIGPVTEQSVTGTATVLRGGDVVSETPIEWDGGIEGSAIWSCTGDAVSIEPAVSGWIHLFVRVD